MKATAPKGKWLKHTIMENEDNLLAHLPDTRLLTEKSFFELLGLHEVVMVKPDVGAYGRGVIQVSTLGKGMFQIHDQDKKITFPSRKLTYQYVLDQKSEKQYIVQQKIPLALIDGNPFDIRVMVQRRSDSTEWNVTGKVCKLAANHYVITNMAKEVLMMEEAVVRSSINEITLPSILSEIDRVCLLAAIPLGNNYSKCRTFGFDIGLDQWGHIWIIEVNLRPVLTPFFILEDKSMLLNILGYKLNIQS